MLEWNKYVIIYINILMEFSLFILFLCECVFCFRICIGIES